MTDVNQVVECGSVFPLVLSYVLLLVAAVPNGSGKANAARTGVGSGIVKIASASYHSLALLEDKVIVNKGNILTLA